MTKTKRAYKQFEEFARNADTVFDKKFQNDDAAKELSTLYDFYVAVGGREGGTDKRLVEVCFGARPIDQVKVISASEQGFPEPRIMFLTERGACMRYERSDSGMVLCTLFPASTESLKQEENSIIFEIIRDPSTLNLDKTVSKHWKAFVSYMKCTSLDSSSRFLDEMRVFWLRNTRRLNITGRVRRTRLISAAIKISGYVVTVGLSGFLLMIINFYFDAKEIESLRAQHAYYTQSVKLIRNDLEDQKTNINKIDRQLKEIKDKVSTRDVYEH